MSKVDAIQHGGSHYKNGYQHWNLLPDLLFGPEYYIGCATKYITRHAKKNGREDIEKALHFTDKLIELCSVGAVHPRQWPAALRRDALESLSRYMEQNGLAAEGPEARAIMYLTIGTSTHHYMKAAEFVRELLAGYPVAPAAPPAPTHPSIAPAGSTLQGLPPAAYTAINPQYGAEGYWGDAVILWKCRKCGVYFKNTDGVPPWTSHTCEDGSQPTPAYVNQG